MDRRALLISLVVVAIGIGLAAFFVFFGGYAPISDQKTGKLPTVGGRGQIPGESTPPPGSIIIGAPGGEETKKEPKKALEKDIFGVAIDIPNILFGKTDEEKKPIESLGKFFERHPVVAGTETRFPTAGAQVATFPAPATAAGTTTPPLTEKEVFDILYPEYFVASLKAAQDFLITEGDLRVSQRFEFKTEKELMDFHEILYKTLLDNRIITREHYDNIRKGMLGVFNASYEFKLNEALAVKAVRDGKIVFPPHKSLEITQEAAQKEFEELLKSQGFDLKTLENPTGSESFGPMTRAKPRQLLSKNITRWLFDTLDSLGVISPVNVAKASSCACFCYTLGPVCSMEGPPGGVGSNTPKPCCAASECCGWMGCYNMCRPRPFIWDPATGICGC